MALQITWTTDAIQYFNEILEYWIERNGSQVYSKKLFQTVKSSLLLLSKHPESGKLTEKQGIRAEIVKNYYIFYNFSPTTLTIVGMCDMRRDPDLIETYLKGKNHEAITRDLMTDFAIAHPSQIAAVMAHE